MKKETLFPMGNSDEHFDAGSPHRSEAKRLQDLSARWLARRPIVFVTAGHSVGELFFLDAQSTTIGRDETCDISLPSEAISRFHARLELDSEKNVTLKDLKSTNGTFVNGYSIREHLLRDGDRIRIGGSLMLDFLYFSEKDEVNAFQALRQTLREPVTGSHTETYFRIRCAEEFLHATRYYDFLSLLLIDIDNMSGLTKVHGAKGAEIIMRRVADHIGNTLREDDLFGRHSLADFAVLLRRQNEQQTWRIADRLRGIIAEDPVEIDGKKVTVSVCVGASTLALRNYEIASDFELDAEKYLYAAKRRGANRVASQVRGGVTEMP